MITTTDYLWKTVEEVSEPRDGATAVVDNWWPIDASGRVAFFNPTSPTGRRRYRFSDGPPQCNRDGRVARLVADGCHKWAVDVVQIPVAYYLADMS